MVFIHGMKYTIKNFKQNLSKLVWDGSGENRPDEKVLVSIEDVDVARGEHTALQHAGRLRQFQVTHAQLHAV